MLVIGAIILLVVSNLYFVAQSAKAAGKREPEDQSLIDNLDNLRGKLKGKGVESIVGLLDMVKDGWNPATKRRATELLGDLIDEGDLSRKVVAPLFESYAEKLMANPATYGQVERALAAAGYELRKKG